LNAILCVDDELIVLMALKKELQLAFGRRFLYETALSAEEGLEVIDQLLEDQIRTVLVISDWLMPQVKGDEFLRMVRDRHPSIKTVMITGQADAGAVQRVLHEATAVAVLRKPWDSKELQDLVQSLCP